MKKTVPGQSISVPADVGMAVGSFWISVRPLVTSILLVFVAFSAALSSPWAAAQTSEPRSVCPDNTPTAFHRCALAAADDFDPPRTPDGRPDLGGVWDLPTRAFENIEEHAPGPDSSGGPTIVVDPPDGRVPARPWAQARAQGLGQRYVHPAAACFLSGVPYIMYRPPPYQFLQTPEHFVILAERAHGYRIVTMDERSPVASDILLWNGVSTGRWEGNTLVVETTNQNGLPWFDQQGRFYTEEARVVERFTLIDANTLHYTATLEDPNVFTQPFTIVLPYRRHDEGAELLEESCYENNEELMEIYRFSGFSIYPGISAEEARAAMQED